MKKYNLLLIGLVAAFFSACDVELENPNNILTKKSLSYRKGCRIWGECHL